MEPSEIAAWLKTRDCSIEQLINAVIILAQEDLDTFASGLERPEDDPAYHCIAACIQHLRDASFAIYASYK